MWSIQNGVGRDLEMSLLSLSGGLYFWNELTSISHDWKYTEDLGRISCLLGYCNTVKGIICSALWLQHKNTRLSTQFRQTELHGGLGADVCSIVRTTIIGVKMSIITNGNAPKTKEEPILSWAYFRCCTFYICKYYIYKGRFIVLLSLSLCSNSLI